MANELLWEPNQSGRWEMDTYLPDDIDSFTDECPECGYTLDEMGVCDFECES